MQWFYQAPRLSHLLPIVILVMTMTKCDLRAQELKDTLQPVWKSPIVYGESSILLQEDQQSDYIARTAFPVEKLISVQSSDREIIVPVEQIKIDDSGHQLRLPRALNLNGITKNDLYPAPNAPNSYRHRKGNQDQWMLYGPGKFFHSRQIEITYQPKTIERKIQVAEFSPTLLPRTIKKLASRHAIAIGVSGDSISTGLDASITGDINPKQPGYVELVAQRLRQITSHEVNVTNRAVAGWSVANGVKDLDKLLESKPDLIIIAYGMNDVGRRDPTWFGQQIDLMLSKIKSTNVEIEVILVASMVGNGEWVHTPREMFEPYRDELKKRVGEGVALADVTSIWLELLKNKHDLDLTGNGLNHPNDFGHRLYAQAILALLM